MGTTKYQSQCMKGKFNTSQLSASTKDTYYGMNYTAVSCTKWSS
jgi:hypothetical protein